MGVGVLCLIPVPVRDNGPFQGHQIIYDTKLTSGGALVVLLYTVPLTKTGG